MCGIDNLIDAFSVSNELPILRISSIKAAIKKPPFMLLETERPREKEAKEPQEIDNLVGFFNLLLKIDMRTNPEPYKQEQNHD